MCSFARSLLRRPCRHPEAVARGGHEGVPELARRRLDDLLEAVVLVAVDLQCGDVDERPLRVHHDLEAVPAERLGHGLLAEHVLCRARSV